MLKAPITFVVSVHLSARNSAAPTVRIFMKFDTGGLCETVNKPQIWLKSVKKITSNLHEDLSTFYCCRQHQIAIKALSASEMVSNC